MDLSYDLRHMFSPRCLELGFRHWGCLLRLNHKMYFRCALLQVVLGFIVPLLPVRLYLLWRKTAHTQREDDYCLSCTWPPLSWVFAYIRQHFHVGPYCLTALNMIPYSTFHDVWNCSCFCFDFYRICQDYLIGAGTECIRLAPLMWSNPQANRMGFTLKNKIAQNYFSRDNTYSSKDHFIQNDRSCRAYIMKKY